MLLVFSSMDEAEKSKLIKLYAEGNEENAKYLHPEMEFSKALALAEADFALFLDRFFADHRNSYYVWSENDTWVSALRLTKLEGFYYLEALETVKERRGQGHASQLFQAVVSRLSQDGPVIIRDAVSKKNAKSLAFHEKNGFILERDPALEYYRQPPEENARCFGMVYKNGAN